MLRVDCLPQESFSMTLLLLCRAAVAMSQVLTSCQTPSLTILCLFIARSTFEAPPRFHRSLSKYLDLYQAAFYERFDPLALWLAQVGSSL